MSTEPMIENERDLTKNIESHQSNIESKAEENEAKLMEGAELLETPPNGDFRMALKTFSEWFKKLFAK